MVRLQRLKRLSLGALSQFAAVAARLTCVDSNGCVIVKVDNTTNGAAGNRTFGRNTVYLTSNTLCNDYRKFVDLRCNPYFCTVWPALFTQGKIWSVQGEIDIIENVNLETANRVSLHTGSDTCVQPTSITSNQTETITATNDGIANCSKQAQDFYWRYGGPIVCVTLLGLAIIAVGTYFDRRTAKRRRQARAAAAANVHGTGASTSAPPQNGGASGASDEGGMVGS
ncbi:hypothetical protein DFH09DRAFT_1319052 [Mycena vulgaris]|nr:hypothetical protein DFH09DRAFT_1319052 [Mycena vulgaris]